MPKTQIADKVGISIMTVYGVLKKAELMKKGKEEKKETRRIGSYLDAFRT